MCGWNTERLHSVLQPASTVEGGRSRRGLLRNILRMSISFLTRNRLFPTVVLFTGSPPALRGFQPQVEIRSGRAFMLELLPVRHFSRRVSCVARAKEIRPYIRHSESASAGAVFKTGFSRNAPHCVKRSAASEPVTSAEVDSFGFRTSPQDKV